jgi:hypothetical protein
VAVRTQDLPRHARGFPLFLQIWQLWQVAGRDLGCISPTSPLYSLFSKKEEATARTASGSKRDSISTTYLWQVASRRSASTRQTRHKPEKLGFLALAIRNMAPLLRNVLRFAGRELRRNQRLLRCGGWGQEWEISRGRDRLVFPSTTDPANGRTI